MAASPGDDILASFFGSLLVAAAVPAGVEENMRVELSDGFADVHAGGDEVEARARHIVNEERWSEGLSTIPVTSTMPPSVAEIAAAINEKQEVALHASMVVPKTRMKFFSSTSMVTSAPLPGVAVFTDKCTRSGKNVVMKSRRWPAVDALRIPTIELKRSKPPSPIEYAQLGVSDVEHGLIRNVIHASLSLEQNVEAAKPVSLFEDDDVHGAAEFVQKSVVIHGDEIRTRCISSLKLQSMVSTNLGDCSTQNHGLSFLIKKCAAAFSSYSIST